MTWGDNPAWTASQTLLAFHGNLVGNTLTWNDGTWTMANPQARAVVSELRPANPQATQYNSYQEGVLQKRGGTAIALDQDGTALTESAPNAGELKAAYDQTTGQLTWTVSAGHAMTPWTARGNAPVVPSQRFLFQSGNSNAVLYLHMEGGLSSLASRGPNPKSSTVVAKLALDPTSTVNHIGLQRQCRHVQIPPGTISHITFFVRTATGHIIDLSSLGATISFVITIGEPGDA